MRDSPIFPCPFCGEEACFGAGGTPGWHHVECKKTAAAKNTAMKEQVAALETQVHNLAGQVDRRDAQIEGLQRKIDLCLAEIEQHKVTNQSQIEDFRTALSTIRLAHEL